MAANNPARAGEYEAPNMDGRITRVEALRRIRERLPEFYTTPPNRLTNTQLMECFPFENRKLVNIGDAANPNWIESVLEADCGAVIDVLTVFAADGRGVEYEDTPDERFPLIELNPFQDIQQEVRILTNNPGRTPRELADGMYSAECFDPSFMRTVAEYFALNPTDEANALFAQVIRDVQAIPEADRISCPFCLGEETDLNKIFIFHSKKDNGEPHSVICANCLQIHINYENATRRLQCNDDPCSCTFSEYALYKCLYRFNTADYDMRKPLYLCIKKRRTFLSTAKRNHDIYDENTNPVVYLERFFANYPGGIINADTGLAREDLNIAEIISNLALRGFEITEAEFREKINESITRTNTRIESILENLTDDLDHDLDEDETRQLITDLERDHQIYVTPRRIQEIIDIIDTVRARAAGYETFPNNLVPFREAREEQREAERQAGVVAGEDDAEQAARARVVREIQRLRGEGAVLGIDLGIDGDRFTCDRTTDRTPYVTETTHFCPYCFTFQLFERDCNEVYHSAADGGVHGPCPVSFVPDARRLFPWNPAAYIGRSQYPSWCRICCRPQHQHHHYHIQDNRVHNPILGAGAYGVGANTHGAAVNACLTEGGGGRVEFYVRVLALRDQIIEDFNNGQYVYDDAMKLRIYQRTMSDDYLGQVDTYIRSGRRQIEPNVARAIEIVNQRPQRRDGTLQCTDAAGRDIQLVLDPPNVRPEWVPEFRQMRGGAKKQKRRTYKKRRGAKQATRRRS